jgi:hypothetical protein
MVQGYRLDPDGKVADERFAVVYVPSRLPASCLPPHSHVPVRRRARDRVPEGSVQVLDSEAAARAAADPAKKLYPARVIGPARSSEGVCVYYIVRWLDEA